MHLLRGQLVIHLQWWSGFFRQKLYSILGPTSGHFVNVCCKRRKCSLVNLATFRTFWCHLWLRRAVALADVAQWIKHQPVNQKVTGLILGQGTCLGYILVRGVQEATNRTWMFLFLSFSLPSTPLKINKIFKKRKEKKKERQWFLQPVVMNWEWRHLDFSISYLWPNTCLEYFKRKKEIWCLLLQSLVLP